MDNDRLEYSGIKCYPITDLTFGEYLKAAMVLLDSIDLHKDYQDINEILELFNVYNIIFTKNIKDNVVKNYKEKAKPLMGIIGRFFGNLTDDNFIRHYEEVSFRYIDDFWKCFEKYSAFEHVSENVFSELLQRPQTTLSLLLKHKRIVNHYDCTIASCMRHSNQAAEIIVHKFLEKHDNIRENETFLPKTLDASEYDGILQSYVESDHPRMEILRVIAESQSTNECPITDKLRLRAKKRLTELWDSPSEGLIKVPTVEGEVGAAFADIDEPVKIKNYSATRYCFLYDSKWIAENLDFPTLFNNFIYLFGYVDGVGRCNLPNKASKMQTMERIFGSRGVKEYETGVMFHIFDLETSVALQAYEIELKKYDIRIEDMLQWFFSEYLPNEFQVKGFVFNAPTENSSILEKCRILPSELDGVFKQFVMLVTEGKIDRELLEISSKPIKIETIPSLLKNKYVYAKSNELKQEEQLLFSDQCILTHVENHKNYDCFYDLLTGETLKKQEYTEQDQSVIAWLEKRKTILVNENGIIHANDSRDLLLRDLYMNEVICPWAYKSQQSSIDELVQSGDLEYGNSLFSRPEQSYFNYVLNKSEFSNGLDLRNKYIHATYPMSEEQQHRDYIQMLKVVIVTILKMNQEFCFKDGGIKQ